MEEGRRQELIGYAVAGVLVAATAVVLFLVLRTDPPRKVSKAKAAAIASAAEDAGCKLQSFKSYGRKHTDEKVAYRTNPPTSGPHASKPAKDGEHDSAPPPESWVHSLEHGRVILQFRPGSRARVELGAIFDEDDRHVLLMPNNTGMPYEVAAVAWRNALVCRKWDPRAADVVSDFRDAYRDTAPERVP